MVPRPVHTKHATVQRALQAAGVQPTVAAGVGVTMLPRSVAERLAADSNLRLVRVTDPIEVHLSLGTPSSLPLSRAAECVRPLLGHAHTTGVRRNYGDLVATIVL